jgi:hypothetical protein
LAWLLVQAIARCCPSAGAVAKHHQVVVEVVHFVPTPLPLVRVLLQAIACRCPRAGSCGQTPPGGGRGDRAGAVHVGGRRRCRWLGCWCRTSAGLFACRRCGQVSPGGGRGGRAGGVRAGGRRRCPEPGCWGRPSPLCCQLAGAAARRHLGDRRGRAGTVCAGGRRSYRWLGCWAMPSLGISIYWLRPSATGLRPWGSNWRRCH